MGIENWFELARGSSYWGFELPRVKLQKMYEQNPWELNFVWVSTRFELARGQVIGIRLYIKFSEWAHNMWKFSFHHIQLNKAFLVWYQLIYSTWLDMVCLYWTVYRNSKYLQDEILRQFIITILRIVVDWSHGFNMKLAMTWLQLWKFVKLKVQSCETL